MIAVEANELKVRRLRDRLVRTRLYGKLVDVLHADPDTFLFPPYLASLMVSERWSHDGPSEWVSIRKLFDTGLTGLGTDTLAGI